tara:strand:- start:3716 stop:5254 length:1539 start_codon:yes stop_codon:yes gene_type:complete
MKKLIVLFFSAALGISFLFIGFGSYFGQSHAIKVGDIKITTTEFSRQYENYKIEKQLSGLSEEEELYSKIQFVNQYVNQLVFEEYLNKKIQVSDNSKKVVLKKSLNNEEMFNNLDEASLQNYLKEISSGINKDIFNNSLNVQELVSMDINDSLLIEKNLTIYEIDKKQKNIQSNFTQEYLDNYNFYKIIIEEYDIRTYLEDNLISEQILNKYYEENINKFTSNKEYSYEQVILDKKSSDNFEIIKDKENAKFKLFENIDEKLILPQIKAELEILSIDEVSKAINIGDKFFYIKKINFNDISIKKFDEVRDTIKDNILQTEISNFEISPENKSIIKQYLKEYEVYSNSFNFIENIPEQFQTFNFNKFEDEFIQENFFYNYRVIEIDPEDLSNNIKNDFISSYSNFQNNIEKNHTIEDLVEKGSIKVNYFTDSLSIKGFFIPEEDLENIITIKKNDLLKIILPNEVVYLSVNDINSIQPLEIKQNIINQIYSNIINQIKKDLEIEVNNQQLLQL